MPTLTGEPTGEVLRQRIRLEETVPGRRSSALRPILEVRVHPVDLIVMNSFDGTLMRDPSRGFNGLGSLRSARGRSITRSSRSDVLDPVKSQPGERLLDAFWTRCWTSPTSSSGRSGRSPTRSSPRSPRTTSSAGARALERYLSDSGEFHYSLQMTRTPTRSSTRSSTSCVTRRGPLRVLRQRPGDAPARARASRAGSSTASRAATGRPGPGFLTVRQKHAHSWVEASRSRPATPRCGRSG